jgi:hypothetical protein
LGCVDGIHQADAGSNCDRHFGTFLLDGTSVNFGLECLPFKKAQEKTDAYLSIAALTDSTGMLLGNDFQESARHAIDLVVAVVQLVAPFMRTSMNTKGAARRVAQTDKFQLNHLVDINMDRRPSKPLCSSAFSAGIRSTSTDITGCMTVLMMICFCPHMYVSLGNFQNMVRQVRTRIIPDSLPPAS